mmetsp:Transcript_43916/g.82043  ORF Transcript_43916/g.82043 Transcript_43916/m.82043 type:complete len:321 (+) Transcript_43916:78-1040(+)
MKVNLFLLLLVRHFYKGVLHHNPGILLRSLLALLELLEALVAAEPWRYVLRYCGRSRPPAGMSIGNLLEQVSPRDSVAYGAPLRRRDCALIREQLLSIQRVMSRQRFPHPGGKKHQVVGEVKPRGSNQARMVAIPFRQPKVPPRVDFDSPLAVPDRHQGTASTPTLDCQYHVEASISSAHLSDARASYEPDQQIPAASQELRKMARVPRIKATLRKGEHHGRVECSARGHGARMHAGLPRLFKAPPSEDAVTHLRVVPTPSLLEVPGLVRLKEIALHQLVTKTTEENCAKLEEPPGGPSLHVGASRFYQVDDTKLFVIGP